MIHSPNTRDVWQVKSKHKLKLFPLHSHDTFRVYSLIFQTSRKKNPHDVPKNKPQKNPSKELIF